MNKNPMINLFLGMLIGCTGTFAYFHWADLDAIIMGAISVIGLLFAVWYNKVVLI